MPQREVSLILAIPWLSFLMYWAVSAVGVKKDVQQRGSYGASLIVRVVIIVALATWISSGRLAPLVAKIAPYTDHPSLTLQIVGILLCFAGIAFAIWARVHIGRNWSPVPTLKEDHELVTSGPYRIVRNPIYTGILLAFLGSALAGGLVYYFLFVCFLFVFGYRVFREDRLMMERFPNTYPAYRRKTKALIPYVV